MQQTRLQHLFWRAGFGPRTETWKNWKNLDEKTAWTELKKASQGSVAHFDVVDGAIKGLLMGAGEIGKMEKRDLSQEEKKQIRQQSREDLKSLNLIWLEEMVHSKAQLREKMALFWHGHFASRNINILYQQQLLAVIREHALGNFGELLRAVSKTAAMLAFLNNQQNKKQHPNENFARELMELFTLGRGHYTENDVKEAARAFTGWGFRLNGDFVFRKWDHDKGQKTVLGRSGAFDGDAVLNIVLEQRQTAWFIARKLYRYFVNEQVAPEARIRELGDRFFDSGYDIMVLLDAIFSSPWFYEASNIGVKIKSPVDLWVGMRRALPITLMNLEAQLMLQKALGQILFFPPNVAGWPGGKTWIDSSSLMLRLRLPQLIALQGDLDVNAKDDDDVQMGGGQGKAARKLKAEIDWQAVNVFFSPSADNDLNRAIAQYLLQTPVDKFPMSVLTRHTDQSERSRHIRSAFVQIMASPEYQLC